MQAEEVTNLGQFMFIGLEQPQPYEAALRTPGRRLLQRHRVLVEPATVLVVSAINDHVRESPCGCRDSSPLSVSKTQGHPGSAMAGEAVGQDLHGARGPSGRA